MVRLAKQNRGCVVISLFNQQFQPAEIDLHSHSFFSDGCFSPEQVAEQMAQAGVRLWSLTDHDTLAGIPRALAASRVHGLHFVPGVELSCQYRQGQVHIVGLGQALLSDEFAPLMTQLAAARQERAIQISQRLQAKGFPDLLEDVKALAGVGEIGRPHFAQAMVNKRLVANQSKAFQLWLGSGKAGDVRMLWPQMSEVVSFMRERGVVSVLAHPHRLRLTLTKAKQLLHEFAAAGGQSVELACPTMDPQWQVNLEREGLPLHLSYSRASDYHGTSPWVRPGLAVDWPSRLPGVWQQVASVAPL